jgi:hypothetical protein
MKICRPRMSPICQRCLASERGRLTGNMSCKLQKLRLSAWSPVVPLRTLQSITLSARELSLSTCPSSKSNAVFVKRPFILIPLCVWYAVMYIASRASGPFSCVLPKTKAFSHQYVTASRLISWQLRQTSQSKS